MSGFKDILVTINLSNYLSFKLTVIKTIFNCLGSIIKLYSFVIIIFVSQKWSHLNVFNVLILLNNNKLGFEFFYHKFKNYQYINCLYKNYF